MLANGDKSEPLNCGIIKLTMPFKFPKGESSEIGSLRLMLDMWSMKSTPGQYSKMPYSAFEKNSAALSSAT